ncbi:MAG: hypothetical protein NVSMB51_08110 [Solirubrobacteraceae bacterium]
MGAWGMSRVERVWLTLAVCVCALGLLPADSLAGNLLATGHDADFHCGGAQCHYLATAVKYVRAGAPDPTKPVLIFDNAGNEVSHALDNATSSGFIPMVPRVVVDPQSATFASTAFSVAMFSAIIVASDETCGGCDLNHPTAASQTPDSDAINSRTADITTFFNAGGGLLYLAGAEHGGGDPAAPQTYYKSVPLDLGAAPVSPPFSLTPAGQFLGFEDSSATPPIGTNNDINCCATHNSFNLPPAGSPLQVAEKDSTGKAETLFVTGGTISGGGFGDPAVSAAAVTPKPSSTEGANFTGTVATFTDPDTAGGTAAEYTATIDWGDGTTSAGTVAGSDGSFTVGGSHTYAEEGSFTTTVVISDATTPANVVTVASPITVGDAPLSASGVAGLTGPALNNAAVATFTDGDPAGTLSDYKATINWGDGAVTAGTISGPSGASVGPYSVNGSHSYSGSAAHTITVTIVDGGGASASAQSAVGVGASAASTTMCSNRKLVLIDVIEGAHGVRLLGAADRSLIGQHVDLVFTATKAVVARPVIQADGSFTATVPLPAANLRHGNRARYQAVLGALQSSALKLVRRAMVTSITNANGSVTIAGRLTLPLAAPIGDIKVKQRVSCAAGWTVVGHVKPTPDGHFKVTVPTPSGTSEAIYVLSSHVRNNVRNNKTFPTATLPRAVTLH